MADISKCEGFIVHGETTYCSKNTSFTSVFKLYDETIKENKMKDIKTQIVAVVKCANGNGEVSHSWTETIVVDEAEALDNIFKWYDSLPTNKGDLILTRSYS